MDSDDEIIYDLEFYFPLLMVKDFNSEGYNVSNEFMTNADVPTIATSGIIENPVNPFTGNLINNSEKTAHDQFVIMSTIFDTEVNNGNTYISSVWGSVAPNTNPRDKENWTFATQKTVLKDYIMP